MSSAIWMRCEGSSELRAIAAEPWRVVEAQHQVSTRKLVDSDDAQELLEAVLERYKPAEAPGPSLHYLLSTPFRYPPLRHGSRFGAFHERGLWYGSLKLEAAFAEVAYYRLLFLEGTDADMGVVETDLTVFRARVKTGKGIDLTEPPFDRWRARISSKLSYAASQPLGRAMREGGVEAFLYSSARDLERGVNIGVLAPEAFASPRPGGVETWRCLATRARVELAKRDYFERLRYRFERGAFLVRGELPSPGARSAAE